MKESTPIDPNTLSEKLKTVGQDEGREGQALLDSYDWFTDPDVDRSMVDAFYESVSNSHVRPGETLNILGLGSGTARMETEIKNTLQVTHRIESNLTVVDRFQSLKEFMQKDINYVIADVLHLPVADNSQDMIICRSVNHYQAGEGAQEMFYQEALRALKPGGIFLNQAIAFESKAECDLMMKIHALIPKRMDLRDRKELKSMMQAIFAEVSETISQTSKQLMVNKQAFIARYRPKEEGYKSPDEYQIASRKFDSVIGEIPNIISSIPEHERPHIWTSNDNFGFNVPYRIYKCLKAPTQ